MMILSKKIDDDRSSSVPLLVNHFISIFNFVLKPMMNLLI